MKTLQHKIVVLSNLKDSAATLLKTAISLAEKTNASIHFFHVKKPTEIVSTDNQLSAKRAINSKFAKTKKEIKELVSEYSTKYNVAITSSFAFGNIKNEIDLYLEDNDSNIIVIGKRRNKGITALGDKVIKHVLKKEGKTIVITSPENNVNPENEISLGVYNDLEKQVDNTFISDFIQKVNKPLRKIEIGNSDKELSNSLAENDVNLLLVDRKNVQPKSTKSFNKLLSKINAPLVVIN